jgi:hypothetical protein
MKVDQATDQKSAGWVPANVALVTKSGTNAYHSLLHN